MTCNKLRNRIVNMLCLLALATLFSIPAQAQKPGGGGSTPPAPVPTGTIYYTNSGQPWSMKGDGSSKLQSIAGEPSQQLHGNSRWFLKYQNVIGTEDYQWFATNDNNLSIQLTSDPNLRTNGIPPAWAKDDSFFSYCGVYETETEWIGRLFVVDIVWIDGIPIASAPTVVFEIRRSVFDEFGVWSYEGYEEVDLGRQDWSPVSFEVALTRWIWGTGKVIDILSFTDTGVETRRLVNQADYANWSPDGSRIAYNRFQYSGYQEIVDIWTINSDGSNSVQLTKYIAGKQYNGTSQWLPMWSPQGNYLVYSEKVVSSSKTTFNVARIPATGGTKVYLTSDGKSSYPRWRQ